VTKESGVEPDEAKVSVAACLARHGIVLPAEDIAFLAAQLPMLDRTVRAVAVAVAAGRAPS